MILVKPQSSHEAKKADLWPQLCAEIDDLSSLAAMEDWWLAFQVKRLRHLPLPFQGPLRDRMETRRGEIIAAAQSRALDLQYARAMERDQ